MPEQAYMDYDEEPEHGACWDCEHMTEFYLSSEIHGERKMQR